MGCRSPETKRMFLVAELEEACLWQASEVRCGVVFEVGAGQVDKVGRIRGKVETDGWVRCPYPTMAYPIL